MTGCFFQSSLHGCPYTAIIDKIIRLVFNNPIVVTTSDNPRPMAVFHIPDSRFLAKCNTGKRETYPYSQPFFGKERRFQTIGQLILIRMTKCRDFYRRAGQLKTAFQRSFPNIQLLTRFTQFSLRKRLSKPIPFDGDWHEDIHDQEKNRSDKGLSYRKHPHI